MATIKNQQKNRRNRRSQKQQNKRNNSTQKRRNLSKNQRKNKSSKRQQNKKQRRQTQRRHRVGGAALVRGSPFQNPECLMHKENMTRIKAVLDQKFIQQLNTLKEGATNAAGRAQDMLDENEQSVHRIALMLVKNKHRVYFPDDSPERHFIDKVKELVFGIPYVSVNTSHQARPQIERRVREVINQHLETIQDQYQRISEINANAGLRENGGQEYTAAKVQRYNEILERVKNMISELKTSLSSINGVEEQHIHVAHELLGDALITITIPAEAIITAYKLVMLKAYVKGKIGSVRGATKTFIDSIMRGAEGTFDQAFDYLLEQRLSQGRYGDNPLPDFIQRVKNSIGLGKDLADQYDKYITGLFGEALDPLPLRPAEQAAEMAHSDERLSRMNFSQLVSLFNSSSEEYFKCLAPSRQTLQNKQALNASSIHGHPLGRRAFSTPQGRTQEISSELKSFGSVSGPPGRKKSRSGKEPPDSILKSRPHPYL